MNNSTVIGLLLSVILAQGCNDGIPKDQEETKLIKTAADSKSVSDVQGLEDDDGSDDLRAEKDESRYEEIVENKFISVSDNPLSTFSIDVDSASYSIVRNYIESGRLPPAKAVRIEEMINYFEYDYPQPAGDAPFSTTLDIASAPWKPENRLLKIGLQGRKMPQENRPAANLVFLVDVSGSMYDDLELLKTGLNLLTDALNPDDRVAIVTYAGSTGVVLESTADKVKIKEALRRLQSGGGTNGAAGIHLAYEVANKAKVEGTINRVILVTDGDFNVGTRSDTELVDLVKTKAITGIELSVLGFGQGNVNDSMMEKISNHGNGNYYYIDSVEEAKKVLVEQVSGTLYTIAKDVKIQIEFNPAKVASYRLIGYENRLLKNEDFKDDSKDAGEIGAGHSVTALYEISPTPEGSAFGGFTLDASLVDPLVYQNAEGLTERGKTSKETVVVKLRYKKPNEDKSNLQEFPKKDEGAGFAAANADFKFCSAVAGFGMILRNSSHQGQSSAEMVLGLATEGLGTDLKGYRKGFIELVNTFKKIK